MALWRRRLKRRNWVALDAVLLSVAGAVNQCDGGLHISFLCCGLHVFRFAPDSGEAPGEREEERPRRIVDLRDDV